MRNYWLKILLGALAVFTIGMIGVTIVRSGIAKVSSVVESDDPITIPLGLVPFVLAGERLGKLDYVTLHREAPNRVEEIELAVDLTDSLLAHGLAGCRLVADMEGNGRGPGANVRVGRGREHSNAFRCLSTDSTPPDLAEFGVAIFRPGDVEVPLLLPLDVVNDLQNLDFGHRSAEPGESLEISVPDTDSIAAAFERQFDSAMAGQQRAESIGAVDRRFADSIRAEARKRMAEDADPQ